MTGRKGGFFFSLPPAKYGVTLKSKECRERNPSPCVGRRRENRAFRPFSLGGSSWEVSQGAAGPSREPQEFTLLVHRTLSLQREITHPSSACSWLGRAGCEHAGCLENRDLSSPVQGFLEGKGGFRLYSASCCCCAGEGGVRAGCIQVHKGDFCLAPSGSWLQTLFPW